MQIKRRSLLWQHHVQDLPVYGISFSSQKNPLSENLGVVFWSDYTFWATRQIPNPFLSISFKKDRKNRPILYQNLNSRWSSVHLFRPDSITAILFIHLPQQIISWLLINGPNMLLQDSWLDPSKSPTSHPFYILYTGFLLNSEFALRFLL